MEERPQTFAVPTPTLPGPLPTPASYEEFRGTDTPIVIDNGATSLRFGFAASPTPTSIPNVMAKYKERKTNRPILLFGESIEVESTAKAQAKYPWEGDVLLSFDAVEAGLDYSFLQLGLDTGSVEHPIVMTERIGSPLHSRNLTSELIFELYQAPSALFCIDSLMSFYHNNSTVGAAAPLKDGLVIGFNTASTTLIPILESGGVMTMAKRIPWGVTQCSDFLLKLVQLKYPNFPGRLTSYHASWMYRSFCEFADDYTLQLRKLKDPSYMTAGTKIVQFPFAVTVETEKTEEELARIAERRKEQGKKLQEMAARVRIEKLAQKEADLAYLNNLRESRSTMSKREWNTKLQNEGIDGESVLDELIKKLDLAVRKAKKKDVEGGAEEVNEEPSFPLLDIPDSELNDEQIKEKRKQRLMKAGHEARIKAKKEKERDREEREAEQRREDEEREQDLGGWTARLRQQHEETMNKIRERGRRKAALNDRKSAASQARMKSIANLASEEKVGRKKRKTADDMFGANDDDWAIYRKINLGAASSDEEDDLAQLDLLEQKLLQYDPGFTIEDTHGALTTKRSALLTAFRPEYGDGDVEGNSRIHLNVERWRVPETYFCPSMAGVDSAGIGEVAQGIFAACTDTQKSRLAKNVLVTGTPAQVPHLVPRLHSTLRPLLPPDVELNIKLASDLSIDAWRGMARYTTAPSFRDTLLTKEMYEERGGEYVPRWWGGNWNSFQKNVSNSV